MLVFQFHANAAEEDTYDQDTILAEAEAFFGEGVEGLAEVIEKVFDDLGRPNGYMKGEEAAGAIVVGVRYGDGTLYMKNGARRRVHWQGPSVGFDVGADAAKAFTLVYNLPSASQIYQRYPGIEGSLYFVAGVGVNYVQSGDIVLAPIRLGVGWRQGINIGYLKITPSKTWNPF